MIRSGLQLNKSKNSERREYSCSPEPIIGYYINNGNDYVFLQFQHSLYLPPYLFSRLICPPGKTLAQKYMDISTIAP